MTKKSFIYSAVILLACIVLGSTQKVNAQKVVSGDLKFLKGQTSINIVFDYTNFKVEKETEDQLVARVIEEKNKKEAGTGDKFKEDWAKDKEGFIEAFKNVIKVRVPSLQIDPNAKYTLIVYEINLINKGWGNKFSGGNPAQMIVDFNFVETANQGTSLCKLREGKAAYMANTGTLSQKIQGCLEYSAGQMSKTLNKNL